jgi:hypothetical protein
LRNKPLDVAITEAALAEFSPRTRLLLRGPIADAIAHGLAQHLSDAGAGFDWADRDLVGVSLGHRCTGRHGGGVSWLHDDAEVLSTCRPHDAMRR